MTEPEYPTEQALDDFDMPTDSTFAVNLSERDRGSLREYEREVSENEKNSGSEKGFKKFIKGIIPMKGDAVSEIVRKIVFMAAIITVFVSAGMLINTYLVQPNIVDNDIKDIKPQRGADLGRDKGEIPECQVPRGYAVKIRRGVCAEHRPRRLAEDRQAQDGLSDSPDRQRFVLSQTQLHPQIHGSGKPVPGSCELNRAA